MDAAALKDIGGGGNAMDLIDLRLRLSDHLVRSRFWFAPNPDAARRSQMQSSDSPTTKTSGCVEPDSGEDGVVASPAYPDISLGLAPPSGPETLAIGVPEPGKSSANPVPDEPETASAGPECELAGPASSQGWERLTGAIDELREEIRKRFEDADRT